MFDLERFVLAQDSVLEQVRLELRAGRKVSHWMWFIFPQLAGLGRSAMAQRFAIGSLAEARAYLGHRILGTRLTDCTTLVNQTEGRSALDIFGHPDDLKFHSSMTLFSRASVSDVTFRSALDCFFGGAEDAATVRLLATASAGGA